MAKYTINHTCGHEVTKEIFGPGKERDRKISWLENQPCLDCLKKEEAEKRTAQNLEAARLNAADGLSPLTEGTEAQVLWAESIRRSAITTFEAAFDKITNPEGREFFGLTLGWLKEQHTAPFWIDTIGTLKSRDGLSSIFSMLDGKSTPPSPVEILTALALASPHINEARAKLCGISEKYTVMVTARLAADAAAEHASNRPKLPRWFGDFEGWKNWNGKIYSKARIFLNNKEIKLSPEQEAELNTYLAAKGAWKAATPA